jgi:soluble lytic murein transglycosylase
MANTRRNPARFFDDIAILLMPAFCATWMGCTEPVRSLIPQGLYVVEVPRFSRIRIFVEKRASHLSRGDQRAISIAIFDAAAEAGLDVLFVAALIEVESEFDVEAESEKGALGLLQVLPSTLRAQAQAEGSGLSDASLASDTSAQIRLGTRYLTTLRRRFGDLGLAVMAYNAGPTRLRFARATGTDEPFRLYLDRVKRAYRRLKNQFKEPGDFSGALVHK